MAVKEAYLSSPKLLPRAFKELEKQINAQMIEAMRETARYGHTAVLQQINKTTPAPVATNAYRLAWQVRKLKDGAVIGNTTIASYFVEMGRKAGKMPPFSDPSEGILPWVKIKRFKFKPLTTKVVKQRGTGGGRKSKLRKPPKVRDPNQKDAQIAFARIIAEKIAKKGTKPRYVMKNTMPKIDKRAVREIRKGLREIVPRSM